MPHEVTGRDELSYSVWMRTPGYLFVGAAESLLKLGTGFDLMDIGGAFVYVKE